MNRFFAKRPVGFWFVQLLLTVAIIRSAIWVGYMALEITHRIGAAMLVGAMSLYLGYFLLLEVNYVARPSEATSPSDRLDEQPTP